MLQSLHVKNIALIDDVEIEFSDGLNILTGETGAGKSILIDSVNFALGSRMPRDVVRDDSEYALCELVFTVDNDRTRKALEELDVMLTDDQVILQRRISNGKSVCKVNAETVPASFIRDIAEHLIDIHGQHEHQSLLKKKNHRIILDSFCREGFDDELCKLRKAYDDYKKTEREYEEASLRRDSSAADLDYSEFVIKEIEAANLSEGEDEELEMQFARMNNSRRIAEIIERAALAVSGDGTGASGMISHAVMALKQVSELDESAMPLYDQLLAAEDLMSEIARGISSYEEELEYSPEEYERVQERLDTINSLKMKYGQSIPAIFERLEKEKAETERLADYDSYLETLLSQKNELYDILSKACKKVSSIRQSEAQVLQTELEQALKCLNFLEAGFEIAIRSDMSTVTADGCDDVEFMISTNPGEPKKPLTEIASGGELSRIMLALKSVLATRDNIGTMIFDEIDTGISGRTAALVAERMSEIARRRQVIAVTHLPQIACQADTHFLIEKCARGSHTSTTVTALSYDDSVEEIARMLAGDKITEAVRGNAKELKKNKSK